jgi:DUF1009 family protein
VKYALIAGNGRFPFLVLEAARGQGVPMAVAAIREEADPALETLTESFHWIGLGELSKLIDLFHKESITHAVMAGQIKHSQIFSSLRPDWRLAKVLFALRKKNTDSLIGAVARVLADEGITLVDSTTFLKNFMAPPGLLTRRGINENERGDLDYGRPIARQLAALDIGQSVVICERACVAVEAMEGTDAVIARAAQLAQGRPLTLVKVAKPRQDMRFDVPVIGPATIRAMQAAGATAIGIDAGRTLLLDRDEMLRGADAAGIAIEALEVEAGVA